MAPCTRCTAENCRIDKEEREGRESTCWSLDSSLTVIVRDDYCRIFVLCLLCGVTKHCTGLTDRNSYRTGIRSPHRRLKRPLRAWRQLQTIGRCLRVRVSGRFRPQCGNFLPVRSVRPVRCFVAPPALCGDVAAIAPSHDDTTRHMRFTVLALNIVNFAIPAVYLASFGTFFSDWPKTLTMENETRQTLLSA